MSSPAVLPASEPLPASPIGDVTPAVPAKISAYYSLVFPNITFFLQTLTVTIGRRCLPPTSASLNGDDVPAASHSPVDVDLGPLKSVSRLHARIEYEEEEARFVLVVIGRNGAWVDGVWFGAGSRVPLGERSQIQIASRTFHFVLPPPAALEDSPSPSSASSVQRARSPSVDITSISPPSSLPSHSPSPRTAPALPPQKPSHSPNSLPSSNAISRTKAPSASTSAPVSTAAPTSRRRKRGSQPLPKPDIMPPKPSLTYAQLCYRAIKGMGGRATLQDICGWMMNNYDWYRYNEGAGWENSVRHNLSSGRAFKKMERSTGEHGKGFFWSIDVQYEHIFEAQEARAAAQAQSASAVGVLPSGKDSTGKSSRKKDKAAPLDPPLRRSVKSGMGPLPPPLTSTPLIPPLRSTSDGGSQAPLQGQLVDGLADVADTIALKNIAIGNIDAEAAAQGTLEPTDPSRTGSVVPVAGLLSTLGSSASSSLSSGVLFGSGTPNMPRHGGLPASSRCGFTSLADVPSSSSHSPASFATLPPSVCLPIVIGPIPSSHPSSSTPDPPPIVLHDNTLILSPIIFSSLAPEQLKALEEMGAQKALEVLQGHIVRYLKERMGKKKRKKVVSVGVTEKGGMKAGKGNVTELSSPFTTVPLPLRAGQSTPQTSQSISLSPSTTTNSANSLDCCTPVTECSTLEAKEGNPPVPVPLSEDSKSSTSIIATSDDGDEEGRVMKRRKLGNETDAEVQLKHGVNAAQVLQVGDEDIEVDVC